MSISRYNHVPFFDIDPLEAFPWMRIRHPLAPEEARNMRPRMDVHESPDSNLTTATFELPGIPKEKVEIKIHGKILTVSGQFTRSSEQQDRGYTTKERASGEFSRSVELPDGTDPKNVNASLENGVLTVTYPKSSPSQEVHRITIK